MLAAIGAGVVAMLMLRAQAEWRAHPAGRSLAGAGDDPAAGGGPRPAGQETAIRRNASAYVTPAARPATSARVAQELAEPVAGLDELARVAEQRLDLALERRA